MTCHIINSVRDAVIRRPHKTFFFLSFLFVLPLYTCCFCCGCCKPNKSKIIADTLVCIQCKAVIIVQLLTLFLFPIFIIIFRFGVWQIILLNCCCRLQFSGIISMMFYVPAFVNWREFYRDL